MAQGAGIKGTAHETKKRALRLTERPKWLRLSLLDVFALPLCVVASQGMSAVFRPRPSLSPAAPAPARSMQTVFHRAETAGHHEVQTACTVMLVLENAVARFPELIQECGAGQRIVASSTDGPQTFEHNPSVVLKNRVW